MSDALILGLATIISATVIAPVVAYLIRRSEKRITDKVDGYRKEVNGHMHKFLETTKDLGKAEGREQEIKDSKQREQ